MTSIKLCVCQFAARQHLFNLLDNLAAGLVYWEELILHTMEHGHFGLAILHPDTHSSIIMAACVKYHAHMS